MLIKNRLDDPIADVQDKRYVDEFGEIEGNILDVMDVDFPKEVDDHVKECVQNWDMYPWISIYSSSCRIVCCMFPFINLGMQDQFNDSIWY